jgi:PTH1 family peptidyl-tRNA hydrolase
MFLICGLGNPGNEYNSTRHNVGFDAIDALSSRYNASFNYKEKFKGEIAPIQILQAILVKPHTYMNLSGSCIQAIAGYYKITIENIIVIHDDLDLKLGKIKVKIGGGSAGHNGLKSIDQNIGKNYLRVRIGIDRPAHDNVASYVLSKFKREEQELIDIAIHKITQHFGLLLEKRLDEFNNLIQ